MLQGIEHAKNYRLIRWLAREGLRDSESTRRVKLHNRADIWALQCSVDGVGLCRPDQPGMPGKQHARGGI